MLNAFKPDSLANKIAKYAAPLQDWVDKIYHYNYLAGIYHNYAATMDLNELNVFSKAIVQGYLNIYSWASGK